MQPKPILQVPGYPDLPRPPEIALDVITPHGDSIQEGNLAGRVVKEKHHHRHHRHVEQKAEVINQLNVAFQPEAPASPAILVAAQNIEEARERNERAPAGNNDRRQINVDCTDCCICCKSEFCCTKIAICCAGLVTLACTVAFIFMIAFGAIKMKHGDRHVGVPLVVVGSVFIGLCCLFQPCLSQSARN